MQLKKVGKKIVSSLLEAQVKRLKKKYKFKIVAVAGSVGKTSTKTAIAKTMSNSHKVVFQEGNYNDRLTVPLVIFGKNEPNIFNIFSWLMILLSNERIIRRGYKYNLAVLEIGTDGPGQLKDFKYLKPDLFVLTSIAYEHMEYFKTLKAVAKEELVPLSYSKVALINTDDVDQQYLGGSEYLSYSVGSKASYSLHKSEQFNLDYQNLNINLNGKASLDFKTYLLGSQGAKSAIAAIAVADILGAGSKDIKAGLLNMKPVSGRMQILKGINNSLIIDDTYNASPLAVKAGLDVLYSAKSAHKIAILGSMNELGRVSASEHQAIGEYCDPSQLEEVITIGKEAELNLAPAASKRGCKVASFKSPYDAGEYLKAKLQPGSLLLFKGSQNGVFAEEAIKYVLDSKDQVKKLVRQSAYWMNIKRQQF